MNYIEFSEEDMQVIEEDSLLQDDFFDLNESIRDLETYRADPTSGVYQFTMDQVVDLLDSFIHEGFTISQLDSNAFSPEEMEQLDDILISTESVIDEIIGDEKIEKKEIQEVFKKSPEISIHEPLANSLDKEDLIPLINDFLNLEQITVEVFGYQDIDDPLYSKHREDIFYGNTNPNLMPLYYRKTQMVEHISAEELQSSIYEKIKPMTENNFRLEAATKKEPYQETIALENGSLEEKTSYRSVPLTTEDLNQAKELLEKAVENKWTKHDLDKLTPDERETRKILVESLAGYVYGNSSKQLVDQVISRSYNEAGIVDKSSVKEYQSRIKKAIGMCKEHGVEITTENVFKIAQYDMQMQGLKMAETFTEQDVADYFDYQNRSVTSINKSLDNEQNKDRSSESLENKIASKSITPEEQYLQKEKEAEQIAYFVASDPMAYVYMDFVKNELIDTGTTEYNAQMKSRFIKDFLGEESLTNQQEKCFSAILDYAWDNVQDIMLEYQDFVRNNEDEFIDSPFLDQVLEQKAKIIYQLEEDPDAISKLQANIKKIVDEQVKFLSPQQNLNYQDFVNRCNVKVGTLLQYGEEALDHRFEKGLKETIPVRIYDDNGKFQQQSIFSFEDLITKTGNVVEVVARSQKEVQSVHNMKLYPSENINYDFSTERGSLKMFAADITTEHDDFKRLTHVLNNLNANFYLTETQAGVLDPVQSHYKLLMPLQEEVYLPTYFEQFGIDLSESQGLNQTKELALFTKILEYEMKADLEVNNITTHNKFKISDFTDLDLAKNRHTALECHKDAFNLEDYVLENKDLFYEVDIQKAYCYRTDLDKEIKEEIKEQAINTIKEQFHSVAMTEPEKIHEQKSVEREELTLKQDDIER